jgi:1-deoxy-D-xylulose-5-phosphate synthase
MDYTYLNDINSPADLKKLPVTALPVVCAELRDFIIHELSHNPGHLGSSLGAVEIAVAVHYVFDTPTDKVVWDVGHQAYAHKILTGRRERFHTNRQFKGLAPFPTPVESEYDAFIAGHASNSISAALGIDLGCKENNQKVVAIIGDGAMTGGLAFEGLNNASMTKNDLLIILNDNNMAIDPIKGGITQYLVDITTSKRYNKWRWDLYQLMMKWHLMDEHKTNRMRRFNTNLKTILTRQPNNIFQGMNLRYFGPADGHNVIDLVRILNEIKTHKGPKVLHLITKKGKGYAPAENDQTTWHAPGEFEVETGERLSASGERKLWQDIFGETLLELAKENDKIVGITPAMPSGCSMTIMQKELPERVYDVGIAEGHAVTFSAGLASTGAIPFCNIYSSFLQRAYDNIIHDVALPKQHVIFCIDRAGIVGNDGATHHGLFDLAYLRPIPNLTIGAPMTGEDLKAMMRLAVDFKGPIAIRYPRGRVAASETTKVEIGKAVCLKEGKDLAVLSIGAIGNTVAEALPKGFAHYDMRWLKPLDTETLDYVGTHFKKVVTVEDGVISGGLGSAVLEYFADKGYTAHVTRLGVNDQFVEHGSTKELFEMLHLDKDSICESLSQELEK